MTTYRAMLAGAAVSAALFFTSAVAAYDTLDDCILDKTFECLDADDFWDCYDWIVEGCNDHKYPLVLPPGELLRLKAETRRKATIIYKRHLATRG